MTVIADAFSRDWDLRTAWSLALAVASPFLLTWLVTSLQSQRALAVARQAASGEKRPPTLPSAIPLFGHIFSFLLDRHLFLSKASHYFGPDVPVRVKLATFPAYIVSGKEAVAVYLKDPARCLSLTHRSLNYMKHAFGCPPEVVDAFRPQSDIALENEIHTALQNMLSGPRLEVLAGRYQEFVVHQVQESDKNIGDNWVVLPDLCAFMEKRVFEGAVRAVFGTQLVKLNPNIASDFFKFNRRVKNMFMGVPRWLNGTAIRARNTMTDGIKLWQRNAVEHVNIDDIGDDVEWEPYYGSKSTRVRQQLLTKRNIMNESARSAENLGFMWATNANSIPAAIWFLLETLHDPKLEPRVRTRLAAARLPPVNSQSEGKQHLAFDIDKLTNDALLQSIYAETLRLRVAAMIVRQPTIPNFSLSGWHIKESETLSLSTRTEHLDKDFWNAGSESKPHPLDRFWAERFLVYPNDSKSGPLKEPKQKRRPAGVSDDKNDPYFSIDGCTWNWVPYGGGRHLCPGRHFAKREIMLAAAIFLTAYDIELLTDKLPGPDENCFGFGTMPPDGKVPCRIRRRRE
ncbi:hypothetical protein MMC30_008541 [Trapelia coarctata]|nr:hypothetical protein [Trapelia coarctata]